MQLETITPEQRCSACSSENELGFDISMAFQPIVDLKSKEIFAQEALVRGVNGEPAGTIFKQVTPEKLYKFDQTCRVKAIELAAKLEIDTLLNINFMPNAVYHPKNCLRTTLKAANEFGFPVDKIVFEVTESERVIDPNHLKNILIEYKRSGFLTAIDDFGAGFSNFNLLTGFQPDFIKLDMELIRDINIVKVKQSIVKSIVQVAKDLGIIIIAEGIENAEELETLTDFGIDLLQGYYFARPSFESLAEISDETLQIYELEMS